MSASPQVLNVCPFQPIDGNVLIVVADSGPGIPAELRDRIFEPFTTAHQIEGIPAWVGLGLTISRRLAELMGGNLMYSRHDGWSQLNLTLPAFQRTELPELTHVEELSRTAQV